MSAVPWGSQVGARQCLPADSPLSHSTARESGRPVWGSCLSPGERVCARGVVRPRLGRPASHSLDAGKVGNLRSSRAFTAFFFFFFSLLTTLGGRSVISTQRRDPNMNWLSLDHNINSQVKAVGFEHRQSRQLLTSHLFFTKSQRFTV